MYVHIIKKQDTMLCFNTIILLLQVLEFYEIFVV
jgi:hypothetical protein